MEHLSNLFECHANSAIRKKQNRSECIYKPLPLRRCGGVSNMRESFEDGGWFGFAVCN
jgi:hypothetical protein